MRRLDPSLKDTFHGSYCPAGGFYIDPVRPVDKALVTHGHCDHARAGNGAVLTTSETVEKLLADSAELDPKGRQPGALRSGGQDGR